MIALDSCIFHWPHVPPLPPLGRPVLICVATNAPGSPVKNPPGEGTGPTEPPTAGRVPRTGVSCGVQPSPRQQARQQIRAALRQVLSSWSGNPDATLPLHETPRGPVWEGELAGRSLAISISYGDGEAWVAVLRGGAIGLDVMSATNFTEVEAVARLFLGPAAWNVIHKSPNPPRAFALAWTALEARLKCLKQPLTEWPANQNDPLMKALDEGHWFDNHRVVSVAIGPA
jgi:hypothetical protein